MKAAVWYDNRDIRIEELPLARPGPGEMVVAVRACGICGSDVVEWYRLPRAPLVQGHEIGAVVVEVGPGVTRFAPGDRVFVAPKAPCGACKACRGGHFPQCVGAKERLPGGFAERILVPRLLVERGAYALPESIDFDRSTFIEPLACAVRSQRIADLRPGQAALVLGCGVSGLLQIQLARRAGCRVAATDVDPAKLERARALGAELAIPAGDDVPGRLAERFGGKADAVILCTGAPAAVAQAWAAVERGGAVVFFAVPGPEAQVIFPANAFWTQEIRVLTSYYCGPPDIEESMRLLAAGAIEVDSLVTHRLPLAETARGFALVLAGAAIKVIIHPQAA
jgi:L-iditol 2-dehydrogenase